MKSIGGYFELELNNFPEYHKNSIRLNTGRNALEYILCSKKYSKIFLPFYTCSAVLEPVKKLAVEFEFYSIDKNLMPLFDFNRIRQRDVFIYTNYFGLCDNNIIEISDKCSNLIIDNAQAFYSLPLKGIDTLYSPRKFFGLSDGAYLYTDTLLNITFEKARSFNRCIHLLGRIDDGAESFYQLFQHNEQSLCNQPILAMSNLTYNLLLNIDYKKVAAKRRENFIFFHSLLKDSNRLKLKYTDTTVPLVYPFLTDNGPFHKKHLISNNIFIPTYWPNVIDWIKDNNSFEADLFYNLLPLPIDQRYNKEDLEIIFDYLLNGNPIL